MPRLVPTSPRQRAGVVAAVLAVLLVGLSPLLGRADVSGTYRPVLPPDALTNGCYPLPGDVVPEFAYVVRRDADTLTADGLRRRTVLHVSLDGAAQARARLEAQFAEAGVGDDVVVEARDFADATEASIVRGELVLDLPVAAVRSDDPVCRDPNSTKRFTPDLPDRS